MKPGLQLSKGLVRRRAGEGQQRLELSNDVFQSMLEHARRDPSRECVGLLVGRDAVAARRVELPNIAERPERRFYADPQALLGALLEADERSEELAAIYHSHPNGPPAPSPADQELEPYAVPIIIVVPQTNVVRGFRMAGRGRAFAPVSLLIVHRCGPVK